MRKANPSRSRCLPRTRRRRLTSVDVESAAAIHQSQPLIEFDIEGNILTANESYARIFGYRPEELKGRTHSSLCEPLYADSEAYKAFGRTCAKGYRSTERCFASAKVDALWLNATYVPTWVDGKIEKILSMPPT